MSTSENMIYALGFVLIGLILLITVGSFIARTSDINDGNYTWTPRKTAVVHVGHLVVVIVVFSTFGLLLYDIYPHWMGGIIGFTAGTLGYNVYDAVRIVRKLSRLSA